MFNQNLNNYSLVVYILFYQATNIPTNKPPGGHGNNPPNNQQNNGNHSNPMPDNRSFDKPVETKRTLITTISANSRIIHPEEDVSLEELRARQPKYQYSSPSKPVNKRPHEETPNHAEVCNKMSNFKSLL